MACLDAPARITAKDDDLVICGRLLTPNRNIRGIALILFHPKEEKKKKKTVVRRNKFSVTYFRLLYILHSVDIAAVKLW